MDDLIDSCNDLVNRTKFSKTQPQSLARSSPKRDIEFEEKRSRKSRPFTSTPHKNPSSTPQPWKNFWSLRTQSEPRSKFPKDQNFAHRLRKTYSRSSTPFRLRDQMPRPRFMGSLTHQNIEKPETEGLFFIKDPGTYSIF